MRNKNILIDGTTISMKMDGLSQYILNIVCNLNFNIANYTLIIRKNECPISYLEKFKALGIYIIEVNITPIGPVRDFQFYIFLCTHRKRFDAAFIPSNQFPIFIKIPTIYTIHDLIYEEFPEQLGKFRNIKRAYLHFVVKVGLRKSKTVIAVSNFTKSEIKRIHNFKDEEKIVVVYEGWEHLTKTKFNDQFIKPFSNYMLYVGSARGHKNLNNLIEALQIIKQKLPTNWGIVIAGNTSQLNEKQKQIIREFNSKKELIKLTGWLTEDELTNYFSYANSFIFPSLSEGFGIPVLESFYHKVPLLSSNKGSLPEVAGNAAIYFDPTNKLEIANTILNFISNEKDLSPVMILNGSERIKLFNWEDAGKTISSFF